MEKIEIIIRDNGALLVGSIRCGLAGLRLLARLTGKLCRSLTDAGS